MRQKRILLRLVKTVDFVNEQNRPEVQIPILPGVFNYPFDIFLATSHRRQLNKFSINFPSDDSRQRCLARPWRPPQNQTDWLTISSNLPQQLALAQQMTLSNHLIQFLRPHLLGQGLSRVHYYQLSSGGQYREKCEKQLGDCLFSIFARRRRP